MNSQGSIADRNGNPEPGKRKPLGPVGWIVGGPLALFFWFGDRALREFWHFSFFASVTIWAAVLGAVVIGGTVFVHVRRR